MSGVYREKAIRDVYRKKSFTVKPISHVEKEERSGIYTGGDRSGMYRRRTLDQGCVQGGDRSAIYRRKTGVGSIEENL